MARGRTSAGVSIGMKPGLGGLCDRRVDQGQFQERADAGEVVEARARHLGAAFDVDGTQRLAELQVVLGLEALGGEVADDAVRLKDGEVLLAADGDVAVDDVPELEEEPLGRLVRLVLLGLGRLDVLLELFGLGEELRPFLRRGLGNELAERLLFVAQFVEAHAGGPAALVGGEQCVDEADVLSTSALRGADTVRVFTEQPEVNHPSRLPGWGSRHHTDITLRVAMSQLPRM